MAVLVNSTNFDSAPWQSYSSNPAVTLGTNDGDYAVWIGLRGRLGTSRQTWQGTTLTRDTVPPALAITSPATSVISRPTIQLQGCSDKPLAGVSFDLTNAAGLLANQLGYVTAQYADTNTFKLTTNWFQGYDLALAPGDNTITLRATDLAGNVTTTNLTITLDLASATNPPAITIAWPLDSTLVAGTNFTLRGSLDDDTASVAVSGLGTDSIAGSVERGGNFRVENLPLPDPTNVLTITATNAAGYSSAIQLTVCQSSVALTINPVPADQLQQPTLTVTGTIGDTSQSVWVNGTPATVDPVSSAWTVDLPAPLAGTINLDVQAGPDPSTAVAAQSLLLEMPPVVRVAAYKAAYMNQYQVLCDDTPVLNVTTQNTAWEEGVGGSSLGNYTTLSYGGCASAVPWPAYWPDGQTLQGQDCHGTIYQTPVLPWQYSARLLGDAWFGNVVDCGPGTIRGTAALSVQTALELATGGLAQPGAQKLILLTVSAAGYSGPLLSVAPGGPSGTLGTAMTSPGNIPLPLSSIQICGQSPTPTATNAYVGQVLVAVPAGSTSAVPYTVTGSQFYSINVQPEDVSLKILDNQTGADLTGQTKNVSVGQQIDLRCALPLTNVIPTNYLWTIPGWTISNYVASLAAGTVYSNYPTTNSNVLFYWVDGAVNRKVQCSVTAGGQIFSANAFFNIQSPNVQMTAQVMGSVAADTNYFFNIQNQGNWTWLHLGGVPQGTNAVPGVKFRFSTDVSGSYGFVQVGSSASTIAALNGTNYSTTDTGVDNGDVTNDFKYPSAVDSPGWYMTDDSPAAYLCSYYTNVTRQDSFTMYLLFQPDTSAPNIFVPIKQVGWSWSGSAVLISSNGNSWSLTSSSPPSGLSVGNPIQYPTWHNQLFPPHWTPGPPPTQ